ncbi:hypothetical protein [Clostridioides sp. ZZV15-6598]|uniref:hypothetical protein n=1 Tax=Clostridioides sp. ZZV15-6598 TaxID=2811501 RepID=UPI001D107A1B|nr:hypothetical protein [Clostridioides sp. ZZV15-6598]
MSKTNGTFILINLLIVIFTFFPNKSFSQESNCLNDFKSWISENEDNSEKIVYTLPCDMVIDDYFELSIPYGTKITIDTNKYKILIKDKGNLFINGNELNIVGEGETEGVIHVERGGKLSIGIDNITALNGTALYAEEEADLIISTYYGEVGNIKASGENAVGIYSENDVRVDCKTIEVDGENAIGIYSKGEVEIEDTSVIVNGDNKQQNVGLGSNNKEGKSIVSETKNVYIIGEQNTIMPDIPQDDDYNVIRCNRRGIGVFEEEIMITKEDKVEDLKLPQTVTLKTSSTRFVNLEVDWDLSNYYTDLDRETEFIIKGKFKEEHLNEKNIVLNDNVAPILYVHVKNKEPINDLEVFFLNSKKGYSAILKYSMPYNAKRVFVEYSNDGINWVSKELDYISNQTELNFEDFKLRCFRVNVEGGLRDGYSNIFLKPGFVMGGGSDQMTPEDDRDTIIDGGDRGGGGRDDPDRDDSSENEGNNNENKEDNNDKNKENNDGGSNENSDSTVGKPNAPEDNIGPSTGDVESENHPNNKEDTSTNSDKENDYEYENKFNSKNLMPEGDSNYNLKQKTVFSNNNQYFSYRDIFLNKDQEINNGKLGVNNYDKITNHNENLKSISKECTLNREIFFLLCILTPIMIGSILAVNPSVRKNIIKFIQIKK